MKLMTVPRGEVPEDWREIASALGSRIRAVREEQRMTQEDLAHRAGISRNQVQNIEASRNNTRDNDGRPAPGPGNPRLSTLVMIARALDVPITRLLPAQIHRGGEF
jgi:transcriptional regulator with XRE-family HTH domain